MIALVLAATLFTDNFESGLGRWNVAFEPHIRVEDSGDPAHGRVMVLDTAGDQFALIKGSDRWTSIRLEGDVRFLTNEHNYLGVIYNFRKRGERHDFGLIYIKGNDSYLQANPHRDDNVSRLVYPEMRVPLTGSAAIEIGKWQHFAVEVAGNVCHFYAGDMTTPQMTFPFFEFDSGALGLQPRCCGGPVWIDNITVTPIERLSYSGPPRPDVKYAPATVITSWQVAGPFTGARDEVARNPAKAKWQPFAVDSRGAVITARIVDYLGPNSAAYFRTRLTSASDRDAALVMSTADDVAVWVNGRFRSFAAHSDAAWFDFATNPAHEPRRIPIRLQSGDNDIVIRIRGGISATGGFFARID